MQLERVINILVPVTLFEMMVAIGLGVAIQSVLSVTRDWRLVVRALAANFLCVPAATVCLLWLVHPHPMAAGFLILAACPGAPYSPPAAAIARGNVTVAVGLMVLLAGCSVLLAPLLLHFLLPLLAEESQESIQTGKMISALMITQLIPLSLGLGLRRIYPVLATTLAKPANRFSTLLNLVLITLILIAQRSALLSINYREITGMIALLAASLAIGWLFGSARDDSRKAMTLTTSLRNVGLGLVIANSAFANTPALTAVLAFGLLSVIGSLLFAAGWSRIGIVHRPLVVAGR